MNAFLPRHHTYKLADAHTLPLRSIRIPSVPSVAFLPTLRIPFNRLPTPRISPLPQPRLKSGVIPVEIIVRACIVANLRNLLSSLFSHHGQSPTFRTWVASASPRELPCSPQSHTSEEAPTLLRPTSAFDVPPAYEEEETRASVHRRGAVFVLL